jgi:hypothetical protein
VTAAQWRLARQIEAILTAESSASLDELAGRTGGTFAEVRTATGPRECSPGRPPA